jgi:hypothetical protein
MSGEEAMREVPVETVVLVLLFDTNVGEGNDRLIGLVVHNGHDGLHFMSGCISVPVQIPMRGMEFSVLDVLNEFATGSRTSSHVSYTDDSRIRACAANFLMTVGRSLTEPVFLFSAYSNLCVGPIIVDTMTAIIEFFQGRLVRRSNGSTVLLRMVIREYTFADNQAACLDAFTRLSSRI